MRWVSLVFVVACLVGCPGPTQTNPDGTPGDDTDAPPVGAATLRIAWTTDVAVPSDIGGPTDNTLDDVRFRMENLHATLIIDPDNPVTTKDDYKLHWDSGNAPEDIVFTGAPPGHYSSVVLQLDDGDAQHAFEIKGTYLDTDGRHGWEIESDAGLPISMDTSLDLAPDSDVTMTIEIGVGAAANTVDFIDDDDITDSSDDADLMDPFRMQLSQGAFRVKGTAASGDN
jgi:hypothetical protein